MLDIIAGEVSCEGDPRLTAQDLPERWLQAPPKFNQHKHQPTAATAEEITEVNPVGPASDGLLEPGERVNTGFKQQFLRFLMRGFVQQYRPFSTIVFDYCLIFCAGMIFGISLR